MSVAVDARDRLVALTPESPATPATWIDVCSIDDILPNSGEAALIGGRQVALVRVSTGETDEIYALSNYDPFSEAFVIARGIVGDRGGRPKIASPIFKQNFDLRTGVCLDDETVVLPTYAARVHAGRVEVGFRGSR
jgi:nitrite reductase (NADH) small subunit